MTDDGLTFHAIVQKAGGATHTRETDHRAELLTWIRQHAEAGDTIIEVAMTARPPAVQAFLAALALGAANLAKRERH